MEPIRQAADRLLQASTDREPCEPVRNLLPHGDVDAAYSVAQLNIRRRLAAGRRVVGRKIGLTSTAVQRQLGVDQPDYGTLLDDMQVAHGDTVPFERLLQPKIEAEIAFVFAETVDDPAATVNDVAERIHHVIGALEIVDSRIAAWDISITDTIADNASSGLFVLADTVRCLADLDLESCSMSMVRNGEIVSAGRGADCLGNPLNAVCWLVRALARFGQPVMPGDIVLSGALGPMADVCPGDLFDASISDLGVVSVGFGHRCAEESL